MIEYSASLDFIMEWFNDIEVTLKLNKYYLQIIFKVSPICALHFDALIAHFIRQIQENKVHNGNQ